MKFEAKDNLPQVQQQQHNLNVVVVQSSSRVLAGEIGICKKIWKFVLIMYYLRLKLKKEVVFYTFITWNHLVNHTSVSFCCNS